MSAQAQTQVQVPATEYQRLSTIRFSFPDDTLVNVQRMRLIGKDLLVYTNETDLESVSSKFDLLGFKTIDRVYKLHVSMPDKAAFDALFGDVVFEDRSNSGRFIATVTVDTEEEYNHFISFDGTDGVRIKSFRAARFTNTRDNASDTREHIEHQGEWQQQRHHRQRQYASELHSEAPYTERTDRSHQRSPYRGTDRGTDHGTDRGTQRGPYRGSQRGAYRGSQRGSYGSQRAPQSSA